MLASAFFCALKPQKPDRTPSDDKFWIVCEQKSTGEIRRELPSLPLAQVHHFQNFAFTGSDGAGRVIFDANEQNKIRGTILVVNCNALGVIVGLWTALVTTFF